MTPERWEQVERVLQAALECEPAGRAALLERECAGDTELRAEVESLLASEQPPEGFLGGSAFEEEAALFGGEERGSLVGSNVGHYLVEAPLGAGGMGEVYLARDLRLGRRVALKLLDPDMARDATSRARFLREARLASSLDHPNICAVHEVGESDGRPFIAMRYVEGETLKGLIGGRPLEHDRVLSIGIQAAEALAAAHERGIIHRDVKPSNIIVTPRGGVAVLDFGIAKFLEEGRGEGRAELTLTGQFVGTPSAMSPEQARGGRVDERTDVWSLGVVLYEMLTGRPPFEGETPGDVIALVLKDEPPPISLRAPAAPAALQKVVARALRKDPDERYQTAAAMLEDLRAVKRELDVAELVESSGAGRGTIGVGAAPPTATSAVRVKRRRLFAALVAALVAAAFLAAFGFALYWPARRDEQGPARPAIFQTTKMTRLTTAGTATAASVSPDGRYVAYALGEAVRTGLISLWPAGRSSLWVKQVSTDHAVQVVPAEDVEFRGTTFSPDGEFVYYVAVTRDAPAGALYRVSVLGGTPRKVLADVNSPVSFSPDGRQFAFVRNRPSEGSDALMVADVGGGGERTLAVRGGNDWFEEDGPAWSPDGRKIVCPIGTDTGGTHTTLGEVSAGGGEVKAITSHRWHQTGRVAWLGDGSGLVLVGGERPNPSFTGTTAQVWHVAYPGGAARRITDTLDGYHHASLGLTPDGRSIVVAQEETSARILVANLDGSFGAPRDAFRQVTDGKFDGRYGLSWTPDGRIVYVTRSGDDEDVWLMNADGSERRRLTDDDAYDETPAVSPDGRHIYFGSMRSGARQVWRMDMDGGGLEMITKDAAISFEPAVSPDGGRLAFSSWRSGNLALWQMTAGGGAPVRLTDGQAARPFFSPDGRLISCAYFDAEGGGRWRLAVIPAGGGGPARMLDLDFRTVNAPAGLRWTPDGRSLVYVDTRGGVSNVWRLPLDGGRPVQLTDFDSGQIFTLALSPDGRRLALARGTLTSDVVLIRDLR